MNSDTAPEKKPRLGMKIKLRRIAAKLTQRQLAKESGVDRSVIARLEAKGIGIRVNDLVAICTVLDVSLHAVVCGSETWNPGEVVL